MKEIENVQNKSRKNMILDFIKNKDYRPLKLKELAIVLCVPKTERSEFYKVIDELALEKEIVITSKGKIMLEMDNYLDGIFLGTGRGFGFVTVEGKDDVFIPPNKTGGAIHKDEVRLKIISSSQRLRPNGKAKIEGEVVKILKRGFEEIVGVYQKDRNYGFVIPDEKKIGDDIYVPRSKSKGAVDGHKVVVKITKSADSEKNAEGEIVEILGHTNDPGVDVLSIVRQMQLPHSFEEEVNLQLEKIPDVVLEKEAVGRTDFRNEIMVTIDGEDTKDIDDAVSLKLLPNGNYLLGVHIADVTHYVRENSPLDKEAYKRGTSVYLADRVIPMLPHKLSNGICSLNANVDRLALSCVMEIDRQGTTVSHEICSSIINVDRRLTYTIVNDLVTDENSSYKEEYGEFLEMFMNMKSLSAVLREKRVKRGAIEFDFPESKIQVDKDGWPIDIKPYLRNVATGIIEEFMLAANESVAEEFFWLEVPFVFRSHEEPDSEKLKKMSEFISNFGYSLKGQSVHPRSIQALLSKIESTPEETIISRVVLRSFKQARYTPENLGHFGLSAKYYCHFTSPIRRYPDLEIHRIIKEHISGNLKGKRIDELKKVMPEICNNCCFTERRAESCEREVNSLKKAQFMSNKVGQEFEGIITSVTSWGIYVELPNTVEGMVSTNDLYDDFYTFMSDKMCYEGAKTKKIYRVGDTVKVELIRVNIFEKKIDFLFI